MITTILISILIIVFTYFLGSISSAILICKTFKLTDPRNYGSNNPGATNTFRIAGYKLAIGVALFDFFKGAISIWLGSYLKIPSDYLQVVAISVCIGHIYPIFFQFHGGKGVATAFGALTAISSDFFIIIAITWITIVLLFGYVSLGSIITTIVIPFYVWYTQPHYLIFVILLSLLILLRHFNNIKRLWFHQEKRIWDH